MATWLVLLVHKALPVLVARLDSLVHKARKAIRGRKVLQVLSAQLGCRAH